jgi:putative ABC transport system substrate-binding protein
MFHREKRRMSHRLRSATQAMVLCVIVLTELVPAFSDAPITVAVVLSREAAPYRQAVRGFDETLRASRKAYKLHEFSMEGTATPPDVLASRIRARRPDLILTVGSGATQAISDQIRDIPIVFSLVLPSMGHSSLHEMQTSHGNLTGSSMEIPLGFQFSKLKEILPSVRRIGVLYNPAVTGPLVQDATRAASQQGLDLVAIPVGSEAELLENTEGLGEKVDVLWSVADSTVFSPQGLKQILLATLRNRIPFIGLSPSFVKAGALLAFSVDYQDVGRQSGEQALRVLAGEDPAKVAMTSPRSISLSLNMNTARQIQVDIEDGIRQKAELFF